MASKSHHTKTAPAKSSRGEIKAATTGTVPAVTQFTELVKDAIELCKKSDLILKNGPNGDIPDYEAIAKRGYEAA